MPVNKKSNKSKSSKAIDGEGQKSPMTKKADDTDKSEGGNPETEPVAPVEDAPQEGDTYTHEDGTEFRFSGGNWYIYDEIEEKWNLYEEPKDDNDKDDETNMHSGSSDAQRELQLKEEEIAKLKAKVAALANSNKFMEAKAANKHQDTASLGSTSQPTVLMTSNIAALEDYKDYKKFHQSLIAQTNMKWAFENLDPLYTKRARQQISRLLLSNIPVLKQFKIEFNPNRAIDPAKIDIHILNKVLLAIQSDPTSSGDTKEVTTRIMMDLKEIVTELSGTIKDIERLFQLIDKVLYRYAITDDESMLQTMDDQIFMLHAKELTRKLINPKGGIRLNATVASEIIDQIGECTITSFCDWYHTAHRMYCDKAREIQRLNQLMEKTDASTVPQTKKRSGEDKGEAALSGSPPPQKKPNTNKDSTTKEAAAYSKSSKDWTAEERWCFHCGWKGPPGKCPWWNHPNCNRSKVPYKESEIGKILGGLDPPLYRLDKKKVYDPKTKKWSDWTGKPVVSACNHIHLEINEPDVTDTTIISPRPMPTTAKRKSPIKLAVPTIRTLVADGTRHGWAQRRANENIKIIRGADEEINRIALPSVLMDTGSDSNFITKAIAETYMLDIRSCENKSVKTIHGTTSIKEYVTIPCLQMVYKNQIVNVKDKVFYIISDLPFPILIGLPVVRDYDLTTKFKSYFKNEKERIKRSEMSRVAFNNYLTRHARRLWTSATEETLHEPVSKPVSGARLGQPFKHPLHATQTASETQSSDDDEEKVNLTVDSRILLDGDRDDDQIDEVIQDPWTDYFNKSQSEYNKEGQRLRKMAEEIQKYEWHIEGPTHYQSAIRKVLDEYNDVFRETISAKPALLPPFEIHVNKTEWEALRCNKGYVRPQWSAKMKAIKQFVDQAVLDQLIDACQAAQFSQVLLTPKANGDWRFCIDYRALNSVSEGQGWPIPNIKSMLQRIGEYKPEIFAVMDATSGYHQAPLSKASQEYTAFITHMGLYRWLRVPMGLKGAPSYFQHQMVNTVLPGLVHTICEIYIDDICVYAKTIREFCDNLTKVLARLRKYNISLNPKKCHFGLSEIEYVGHVIDKEGLSFSPKKLEKVKTFRRPDTQKALHEFLGLTSYFRDHIKNHSEIVRPLQQMLAEAQRTKTKKLAWNDEVENAWNQTKEAVINCPKLHWLTPGHPVYVNTDASDFGIGAYLYQDINGHETPIAFISKTLNKVERKWSTIEKEAYAIFYALTKWENYLRDNKFTLRTDHANLTYINHEGKQKVQRWKLALQEYDFWIEHIKGVDNIVADRLSRFCDYESPDDSIHTMKLNNIGVEEEIDHIQEYYTDKPRAQVVRSTRHLQEIINHVIPKKRYKIISKCHNTIVGHFGVQETMNKVRKRLDNKPSSKITNEQWSTTELKKDVMAFIRTCPCCQKMAVLKKGIQTHGYTTATWGVFDNIAIDVIMGLPEATSGNKNLMVIIDTFSRYIELYPMKELTAINAVKALKQWMARYGVPRNILTDNASQFMAQYEATLKVLGIKNEKIHPYSHEENAIVERANREIIRHLRNILHESKIHDEWEDHLPDVMRIKNATRVSSTGVAPAELVFGSAYRLEAGILYPHKIHDAIPMPMHEYLLKQYKIQQAVLEAAYKHQDDTDAKHMARTPAEPETEFDIDAYVLVQYENDERAPPSKIHPKLKGPYQIIDITRRNPKGTIYTCRNLATQKLEDFHVKLLVPYYYDSHRTDPAEAAMADSQMFEIETVLDHVFDSKKQLKSMMRFKIKWVGYETPTWEPYKTMSHVQKVHEYLRAKGFSKFIPQVYQQDSEYEPKRKRSKQ